MFFNKKRSCHLLLAGLLVWVAPCPQIQAQSLERSQITERDRGAALASLQPAHPGEARDRRQESVHRILLLLSLCLGLVYVRNIYAHSRFILLGDLSSRIQALCWNEVGDAVENKKWQDRIRSEVWAQLPVENRIRAWLKANPLALGLPGQYYEETIELGLGLGVNRLRLRLEPKRNSFRHFRQHPIEAEGKLFARATLGVGTAFFGHFDRNGKISSLTPNKQLKGRGVAEVQNETKLVDKGSDDIWREPRQVQVDGPAGWKISRSG